MSLPRVLCAITLAAAAGGALLGARAHARALSAPSATTARPAEPSRLPPRVEIATCTGASSTERAPAGDPAVRKGAQSGLQFVAKNASAWQDEHKCYGCHVQAVTLEALTVGKKNQYDVSQAQIDKMLQGMLDLRGGAHKANGLAYEENQLLEPARAFGGAAFAHYDAAIDGRVRQELLDVAKQLIELQKEDGHVGDYSNGQVAVGPLQTTTQALQTWRQAYERSADERWLAPMRRAEAYIQSQAKSFTDSTNADPMQLDYAIIGLVSAGASRSEAVVQSLAQKLAKAQAEDGAWGASALVTGASLYALRLSGMNDGDAPIARGTRWLLRNQGVDGGWSHAGSARGEAMWAVLGLVTLDVVTVDVSGIAEGAHVEAKPVLYASARDNGGGAVSRIDVAVDDVTLKSACGASLDFTLDSAWLGDGAHTVDVVATNARGQTSKRRVQIYAGAYYLTELGTRFEDNGTTFALRDLAPPDVKRTIELRVFATKNGARDAQVFEVKREGAQGPVRFFWNGKDAQGKPAKAGPYVAELRFVAPDGHVVQSVDATFVNDTLLAQQAKYAEIEGQLNWEKGALGNTEVELLDENDNVVQRVKTTGQGNYRFRNLQGGNYKVRAKKDGFDGDDAKVTAKPAAPAASAPVMMKAR